ncbi:MAG: gliding motility-associated C-terminal domain-containing protein [Bdellovibrionales bacterium]|nr:gliding motility-associated C-terminal domain-containing protein [Bdellovibrionales bacterium]
MGRWIAFHLLSFFFVNSAPAQNLVVNPGFEQFSSCPGGSFGLNSGANPGWSGPSTEYYTSRPGCTDPVYGLSSNYAGTQDLVTETSGDSYAGVRVYASWGGTYRERIYGTLSEPTVPGITYQYSMKVSLAETSSMVAAGFGMGFTDSLITSTYYLGTEPPPLHGHHIQSTMVTDMLNWTTLTGSITATAGVQHITIGTLGNPTSTVTLGGDFPNSYYFVDDVELTCTPAFVFSVTPRPACDALPQLHVQTPNAAFTHWTLTTPNGQTFTSDQFVSSSTVSIQEIFPEELFAQEGMYSLKAESGCQSSQLLDFGTHTFEIRHTQAPPIIPQFSGFVGTDAAAWVQAPFQLPAGSVIETEGQHSGSGNYQAPNGCSVPVSIPLLALAPTQEMLIAQEAQENENFFAPNAFTPDGDGINEAWHPAGQNVVYSVVIFDRWGSVVFEANDVPIHEAKHHAWLGGYRGGQYAEPGTYAYRAHYRGIKNSVTKEVSGSIQLIR